jgi:DNA-binding NarL/FixJ family response regulator
MNQALVENMRVRTARLGTMRATRLQPESRPLTTREREILKLVEAGQASKQIADVLKISTNTVNNHRASILAKLGAHSAIEALRIYHKINAL